MNQKFHIKQPQKKQSWFFQILLGGSTLTSQNKTPKQGDSLLSQKARISLGSFWNLLVILGFLATQTSWAGSYDKLLNKKNRPTMSEFITALSPMPSKNPFKRLKQYYSKEEIRESGSQIVSDLESTFSGNIWAPIGRDSVAVADLLEAFAWVHYQQKNRVVRIHASRTTFNQKNKYQDYQKVLQIHGLIDEQGQLRQPFVLLDPTNWKTESQSRSLLSCVYQEYGKGDKHQLLRLATVVALGNTGTNCSAFLSFTSGRKSYFSQSSIQSDGIFLNIFSTDRTLAYPTKYKEDEVAWHDQFQPLTQNGDGTWTSLPGDLHARSHRKQILYEMYQIYSAVQDPRFLSLARKKATEQYGYDLDQSMTQFLSLGEIDSKLKNVFKNPEEESELTHSIPPQNKSNQLSALNTILMAIREHTLWSNPILRTSLRHLFQPYEDKLTQLDFDHKIFTNLSLVLDEESHRAFFWDLILKANTPRAFLDVLRISSGAEFSDSQYDQHLTDALPIFFGLNPSLLEINELIEGIKKNSSLHLRIATNAFRTFSTMDEYDALTKPSRWKKKSLYSRAKIDLMKRIESAPQAPQSTENNESSAYE